MFYPILQFHQSPASVCTEQTAAEPSLVEMSVLKQSADEMDGSPLTSQDPNRLLSLPSTHLTSSFFSGQKDESDEEPVCRHQQSARYLGLCGSLLLIEQESYDEDAAWSPAGGGLTRQRMLSFAEPDPRGGCPPPPLPSPCSMLIDEDLLSDDRMTGWMEQCSQGNAEPETDQASLTQDVCDGLPAEVLVTQIPECTEDACALFVENIEEICRHRGLVMADGDIEMGELQMLTHDLCDGLEVAVFMADRDEQ